ncbi:MAG: UspA domain protein [Marmoricola sp.]|nr:UspA domain protein [Marmoricola sp.]
MDTKEIPLGAIVVGVDGSTGSNRAVLWAVDQAALERRPLVLAHAISPVAVSSWMIEPGFDPTFVLDACRTAGAAELTHAVDVATDQDASVVLHQVLTESDPRDALLELAEDASMVVLGSRGRGPMASLFLGSVSLAVTQHAACPVVVLREGREFTPDSTGQDRDLRSGVLVGVDGTKRSSAALEFAYRIASVRSLPLTVLHAYWDEQTAGYPSRARSLVQANIEDQHVLVAEVVAGMAEKFPDVRVSLQAVHDLPHVALLRAAERAELVVIGTHPTNAFYDLLTDEVSRQVVGRAPCVVVVVPDACIDAGVAATGL